MCSRIEENVAELEEEVEVAEQGYQVQESFEKGKLPPNLLLCYCFPTRLHIKAFWKKNKTLSPMCDNVIRYFATLLRSSTIIKDGIETWLIQTIMLQHLYDIVIDK